MENSHIEWTDNTFNIAEGCEKVSPGCKNCYAESRDKIWHRGCHWGPGSTRKMMSESYWQKPLKWNEQASAAGVKTKVFCSSLCDVFEDHPDLVAPRARLFELIEQTPHLIWQLLTKRPENIMTMVPEYWLSEWPVNVWMGTTVENQEYADLRIPELLSVPAKIRFLSCEPLLGPVKLTGILREYDPLFWLAHDVLDGRWHDFAEVVPGYTFERIAWVICGGESGRAARPIHPDWARSLRDQCAAAGVPFFFKQWGEYRPRLPLEVPNTLGPMITLFANGKLSPVMHPNEELQVANGHAEYLTKVGKKYAGALLDGKEYKEFPG